MLKKALWLFILIFLVSFIGCDNSVKDIPYEYISDEIGHEEKGLQVAINEKELEYMLENAFPPGQELGADLDKFIIIGVFMGQCPTGGYAVGIDSMQKKGSELVISVTFSEPDPDDFVIQVITYPGKVLSIERKHLYKIENIILKDEDGNIISSYSINI